MCASPNCKLQITSNSPPCASVSTEPYILRINQFLGYYIIIYLLCIHISHFMPPIYDNYFQLSFNLMVSRMYLVDFC